MYSKNQAKALLSECKIVPDRKLAYQFTLEDIQLIATKAFNRGLAKADSICQEKMPRLDKYSEDYEYTENRLLKEISKEIQFLRLDCLPLENACAALIGLSEADALKFAKVQKMQLVFNLREGVAQRVIRVRSPEYYRKQRRVLVDVVDGAITNAVAG